MSTDGKVGSVPTLTEENQNWKKKSENQQVMLPFEQQNLTVSDKSLVKEGQNLNGMEKRDELILSVSNFLMH